MANDTYLQVDGTRSVPPPSGAEAIVFPLRKDEQESPVPRWERQGTPKPIEPSRNVRLADTENARDLATSLINKMYAWRGYGNTHELSADPHRSTLAATVKGEVVATVTVGLDSPIGLLADDIFKEELDALRGSGARLCEFCKLAVDPVATSKISLGHLFHQAVIYARDIHHCTDIVLEVNPRHRRFYQALLGCECHGELKKNRRVNAPAYLLRLEMDYIAEQVRKHGGTFDQPDGERSFYRYFFSPREERGILNQLLQIQEQAA